MEEILVSIICNTYNHKQYIRDALEGFIAQKTDFAFEILVHDDASTDGTADIIREYEAKYPKLIKPIYQTENQYSQKTSISKTFQFPRVRGKYIALCEGDDYWIDNRKLQKQVDALENHPELDICATCAQRMVNGELTGWIKPSEETCVFTPEQVVAGGGGFVPTASLMFRNTMIETYSRVIAFDYAWQIYGSLRGGMLYLAESMCVYRVAVSGSWTSRMQKDIAFRKYFTQRVVQMLRNLNEETHGKYSQVIENNLAYNQALGLVSERKYRQLLTKENHRGFKNLPIKKKIKVLICAVFPWADKCWDKIKKGNKNG